MKYGIPHTQSFAVLIASALLLSACWGIVSVATPTPITPIPTATMTETDVPTVAPTDTLTATATRTPSDTPTQTPSDTPTPTATVTETATMTRTPIPTVTHTPTPTLTPSASPTPDDPTPTREVLQTAPAPTRYTLTQATYFYACADVVCTRYLFPAGTVYEVWDTGTNEGWLGVAIPVTDYLYATFWMQRVTVRQ